MDRKSFVSVIIPAFNEEKRIVGTLEIIQKFMESKFERYEIIVVDDGSRDLTTEIIDNHSKNNKNIKLIKNGVNRGKGFSVRNGFIHSKGEYLLFSDADLSTPIDELENIIRYIIELNFDIAIGSRAMKDSNILVHQPWYREVVGRIFNLIVRMVNVKGLKDTQCGFKCFRREAAIEICKRQFIDRFSFDVEMLYIAGLLELKIAEVPVRWLNEPNSKVSVVKDSINMFFDLLRIRFYGLTGKYN